MTTSTAEQLVSDYLGRLRFAASVLPAERRAELVEELEEQLASARQAGELGDGVAARTLLDRLGPPQELVAAARDDDGAGSRAGDGGRPAGGAPPAGGWSVPAPPAMVAVPPSTTLETVAVLMLTAGSVLPVVGWLVGVVLLWTSRRWRVREKLLGTLVVPGGPGSFLVLGSFSSGLTTQTCTITGTVGGDGTPSELVPPTAGPFTGGPEAPPSQPAPLSEPTPPSELPGLAPPSGGFATTETCTGTMLGWPVAVALAVVAVVAPLVVAVFLLRRARARAAAEPPVLRPARGADAGTWGGLEIVAVVLLTVGPFLVPVVASVVGLVLACCSTRWSAGEKAVAAALALAPSVLLAMAYLLSFTGVAGLALGVVGLFALAVLGSLSAGVYLAVVLSRRA